MTRRNCLLVLLIGALVATASPLVSAQSGIRDKVSLRLDFFAYGGHAAFAYGIERGIYAKEGIGLTLLEGNGSGAVVQQIGAGIDRFGWADATTMVRLSSKGLPVKMIANYMQISPIAIIFFEDRGIKTPKDLEGKKIAFTAGDSSHQNFPAVLKMGNVDKGKVQEVLLDVQAKSTAMLQGVVDGLGGYFTTYVPLLSSHSKRKISYLRYADHGANAMANGFVMHTKYLDEKSLNCRFIRATTHSFEAAMKDPDAAVEALHKLFPKVSAGNKEVTKQVWVASSHLVQSDAARGKPLGYMTQGDWDSLLTQAKQYGGLSPVKDSAEYYTNDFVDCK
jgi:NitT/TauT family transport system substrate-binding protein